MIMRNGLVLVLVFILHAKTVGQRIAPGILAQGTRYETNVYVTAAEAEGPTVFVVGGIHGNEPAGARAADQIRGWSLKRGKLVVVPGINRLGLARNMRHVPGVPRANRDLNRNFPGRNLGAPRGLLAGALWDRLKSMRPAWLIDLHEGVDLARMNPVKAGNSLVFCPEPETRKAACKMVDAVNASIRSEDRKFVLKRYPGEGALARAATDRLGIRGLVLVTTRKTALSLRVRQHRIGVHALLEHLGMASGGPDVFFGSRRTAGGKIRAALYDGFGARRGPAALDRILRSVADVTTYRMGPHEIRGGALRQFDVLIQPGGKSRDQAEALGEAGRVAIRNFVQEGGGYLGFCAGAYLATCGYRRYLHILDAKLKDAEHRLRGRGTVMIRLTGPGRKILGGRGGRVKIRYANGPILVPGRNPEIPDFEVLAVFCTEVVQNWADKNVMKDTPAVATGRFGKGRVICFSPHPEYTPGLESFVHRGVRWAAGR